MRLFFLSFFCLFATIVMGGELYLKEQFQTAKPQSYLVTLQDKTYTFFHIYEKTNDHLIVEEVTLPINRLPKGGINWKTWFETGGAGHTSWTMTQIDLKRGSIQECYSFTRNGWYDTEETNRFMRTLLSLRFSSVPNKQRRKIGHSAKACTETSRLWSPPLIVNGQHYDNASFSVYKSKWPRDKSEMSNRYIEIYIPDETTEVDHPSFFPYWLEIEGSFGNIPLRVIDSGMEAISPKPRLPYRSPRFVGAAQLDGNTLSLTLKSPIYYTDYTLLAEEIHSSMGKTFILPCTILQTENGLGNITLEVPIAELEKQMLPGEHYRFIVTPNDHPSVYAETERPFKFQP